MTTSELKNADQTALSMVDLVQRYAGDIGQKAKWPLAKYFRFVANLEYRPDPKGNEAIARPRLTLADNWPWRDCDDKAILIGSWCYLNGLPFRFVASSKRPDHRLHHVWVMAKIEGKDFPLDATYPKNFLGYKDPSNKVEKDLTGDIMRPTLNVYDGDYAPLLGASFLARMKRKTGNVARQAQNVIKQNSGAIDSIGAAFGIPPGTASKVAEKIQSARGIIAKVPTGRPNVSAVIDSLAPQAAPASAVEESYYQQPASANLPAKADIPIYKQKWFVPALGGGAVLLYLLSNKKGT